MAPNVMIPVGINVLALSAVLVVFGFTVSRVLATAPELHIGIQKAQARETSAHTYAGILSWVSATSVRITDHMGAVHEFSIDTNTKIYQNRDQADLKSYHDLRVFDHVRVETIRDSNGERAQLILDIR